MMRWAAVLVVLAPLQGGVEIRVSPEGWGDADVADIRVVLRSAAEALGRPLPVKTIEVSRGRQNPITLYERGPGGEVRVKLNVEGRLWSQFAYQFAHEMGHIACGYAEYSNPNLWFEETLCEAASLFVLGRMAEAWKTRPPYPNWKDYSGALAKYREERLKKGVLPEGVALAEWFRGREDSLRKDGCQRDLNTTMAVALLPLFEEAPGCWEAVSTLNAVRGDAARTFRQYLRDWSRSAPEKDRAFIGKLAGTFGVTP